MGLSFKSGMTAYTQGRRVNSEEWNTISRTQESATALGFGVPVQRGSANHGCVILTNGEFLGVSEASLITGNSVDSYARYDTVPVMTDGVIGVLVGENVTQGALAGWNGTAWVVADTAAPAIPGCQFDESGGSGAIVPLRVKRVIPTD